MARKKRTQYTEARRKQILEAAVSEKLTAAAVKKKYGVTPVTYYSWRKKYGVGGRRGGAKAKAAVAKPAGARAFRADALTAQLRSAVQSKLHQLMPGVVRAEVESYLGSVFGRKRAARRRRRKTAKA